MLASVVVVLTAGLALGLAGCGDKRSHVANPVVARVDGTDITQQQVHALLQQRGVRADQADAAGRQVLERLIDQELAFQRAEDLALARDPRVAQTLESTRREVLARAYLERAADGAERPTPDDVRRHYDERPALFAQRQLYTVQETSLEVPPERVAALRERFQAAKDAARFLDELRAEGVRSAGAQVTRPAEQWAPALLERLTRLQPGQGLLATGGSGVQLLLLVGVQPQPVSFEQARPVIEQLLTGERRRKRMEDELRRLRQTAKLQYLGPYAELPAAASAPASAAVDAGRWPASR